jgi:hypothetical protein
MNACICLLNQAGIAQRQAPFAALTLTSANGQDEDQEQESSHIEMVSNLQGDILWMQSQAQSATEIMLMQSGFEKKVKSMVKAIVDVTFS